jgi:hypothetical protein
MVELRCVLARRHGSDGECVHAAFELTRECFIDHTVALDSALSFEGICYDIQSEMALPTWAMAGMSLV